MEKRFFFFSGNRKAILRVGYIVEFKDIFENFLNERAKDQTFPKYLQVEL
ncbi:hypothetical protein LEP1GSC062_1506 [Leptospira alexanderi serovar Manhao 3 str. L 60]|uniref:Uncharacterized protein n=1 Tax=Leptospira alexanderi serovar Manhao 3 str. L 60 TaxID=1049759 RepID=V6HW10_9LEPT|nr:hypothetical protein LEP1GSC062_1506 [Leptospira alexanderi serovar Manhao 3 str. L 60]